MRKKRQKNKDNIAIEIKKDKKIINLKKTV